MLIFSKLKDYWNKIKNNNQSVTTPKFRELKKKKIP